MRNLLLRRKTMLCVSLAALLVVAAAGAAQATGSMATARGHHKATRLADGTVLVVGGYNAGYLASAEIYNPVNGAFLPTAGSLATARDAHTATLLGDGTLLVLGGFGGAGDLDLASAEIYNPVTGAFSPTTRSLATSRDDHTATR